MSADIRIDAMVDCNFSFSVMRYGSSSFSDWLFGSNLYFKHFGSSFSVMRFGRCSFSVMRCGSNSASCASASVSSHRVRLLHLQLQRHAFRQQQLQRLALRQ